MKKSCCRSRCLYRNW